MKGDNVPVIGGGLDLIPEMAEGSVNAKANHRLIP